MSETGSGRFRESGVCTWDAHSRKSDYVTSEGCRTGSSQSQKHHHYRYVSEPGTQWGRRPLSVGEVSRSTRNSSHRDRRGME